MKWTIDLLGDAADKNDKAQEYIKFKNNAPFRSLQKTVQESAGDLEIIMAMHNVLEYRNNYSMTLGSLGNYYRYKIDSAYKNSS